ncbi:bifunctional DNA-formamidopyrimidine glycosylase/DNA-(apurinic or apyrimidinic site) lyase [Paenarthrobacter sp. Z7-10]|uniref:bifunctional DNA-formamidopyrimidine glycosylase/DNA-(apurinic or apyrimidinic site) lyase n=1 Tax=Paenarthrobacter sp. Z7-10 TaxID=2787635 RepID=UPI0022A8D3E3|nr:bifunctional DNA-formamidopyrimidine glycosylase/DNA-(apurinic or apyrimidinic site) lyase [Paenarthrobacter sp. Z7-10]MCZ2403472.1 bifunctional DNA-formamidopyrimidine glycosylase/DNA-(apurinic or apyrimidinic site) lyase [Paenarthrobacter sp. Z7-10]
MPELPEVEVVRRGLARWVSGRTITGVQVLDPRSIRRHALGVEDFRGNLIGTTVLDVVRRGKFLWLPLGEMKPDDDGLVHADDDGGPVHAGGDGGLVQAGGDGLPHTALMAHLGMSGQLLMQDPGQPDEKHLKVRLTLSPQDGAPDELRFVDQRIFGGLFVTSLIPTADGHPGGHSAAALPLIAAEAAHIGRDPLDPAFSMDHFYRRLHARKTGLKRALLDQGLVSGIGNIYADEALWAAKLHYARPTDTLRRAEADRVLEASRAVMLRALDAGGTSFDSLYVNVNGTSGYFERSLNAYGREGQPCPRCAGLGLNTKIRRDTFMNRSSYSCPVCQPRPRNGRW